jgi:integrase/recombinase XerC
MIESFLKHLQYEKRLSGNTVLAYGNDLQQLHQYLLATHAHSEIHSATYTMIRSWIVTLVESGIEPSSINRKIACLRTFFKFLMRMEVVTKDPTARIPVLKTKKRLPAFVKEERQCESAHRARPAADVK